MKHGLDPAGRHFVSGYGSRSADATLLLLPIVGFLPPDDPRIRRTISWVRSELGEGPFLHRYHRGDGIAGREGAFSLCGFWLAEAAGHVGET